MSTTPEEDEFFAFLETSFAESTNPTAPTQVADTNRPNERKGILVSSEKIDDPANWTGELFTHFSAERSALVERMQSTVLSARTKEHIAGRLRAVEAALKIYTDSHFGTATTKPVDIVLPEKAIATPEDVAAAVQRAQSIDLDGTGLPGAYEDEEEIDPEEE
ncbi:MAG: hypothetical protein WAQ27_03375 [Candidatus Microsaccharimonas sp.]